MFEANFTGVSLNVFDLVEGGENREAEKEKEDEKDTSQSKDFMEAFEEAVGDPEGDDGGGVGRHSYGGAQIIGNMDAEAADQILILDIGDKNGVLITLVVANGEGEEQADNDEDEPDERSWLRLFGAKTNGLWGGFCSFFCHGNSLHFGRCLSVDKQDSDLTYCRKSNFAISMKSYLRFEPIYQERVWGGRALAKFPGRELPGSSPIGESWELVDREEANSVGLDGVTLGALRKSDPESLMGPGWDADRPFPILVKWLDCRERLSLQVHPPAAVAPKLKGEPKTENWYIAEATEDAALLAGLQPGVDAGSFREALESGQLEGLVCRLPSGPGDSLFVPSGRLHAIDGGNLILEIQQNSDTTYRVYDWGRVGLDGKPRQLHIEESMESIDFSDREPELIHPSGREAMLAECAEFRLRRLELEAGEVLKFQAHEEPRILSVVEGTLSAEDGFVANRGDNLLLPYVGESTWTASEGAILLLTDRFNA